MASIAGSFFLGSLLIRVVYCMFLDKLLYWWLNISLYALKIKMIKFYYKPPCLNSLSLEIVSCDKIKRHMTVCLKLLETSFLFFNIQTIFYLKKHWHCFDVTNKQLNIKKIFFAKNSNIYFFRKENKSDKIIFMLIFLNKILFLKIIINNCFFSLPMPQTNNFGIFQGGLFQFPSSRPLWYRRSSLSLS